MSDDRPGLKGLTESVSMAQSKLREQRVQRLKQTLEKRLTDPIPTVDALMAELGEDERHPELWEQLHGAAVRDGLQAPLADAYKRCAAGPRMKRLAPEAQAIFLMHAADYFQGVLGDDATAEGFLLRVIEITPGDAEAFARLERRLEAIRDTSRLLDLYAAVAATPPKPVAVLATQALNILLLPAKAPFSDTTCKRLVALVAANPRILDALEQHCASTKRARLACAIIEEALAAELVPPAKVTAVHERAIDLYMSDPETAADALLHAEELLEADPNNAKGFAACERLMSNRAVGTRAANALRLARQARGFSLPPGGSA